MVLWLMTGIIAYLTPWPYGVSGMLFATCLHFAALDGDVKQGGSEHEKN